MIQPHPTHCLFSHLRHRAIAASTFVTVFVLAMLVILPSSAAQRQDLPLSRIVLLNSGVGFYERNGTVEGDSKVDLQFKTGVINDLLKSLVVMDLDGGHVSTVTYGSKDPITKTLKTFAIDLTDRPTIAQLLDQVRGETVELESPEKVVGTVLSIERRNQRISHNETISAEVLNLLTEGGLRSIFLKDVGRIRLANKSLDRELRQALTVLSQSHETDKKTVSLQLTGKGKRRVRVGYVQESPVWKTSYRLVIDEKRKPFLQGWAIVENTTDSDWRDVKLTLMSGRPLSYVMDLYQPLYLPRPVVEPELYASLRPQTHRQGLATMKPNQHTLLQSRQKIDYLAEKDASKYETAEETHENSFNELTETSHFSSGLKRSTWRPEKNVQPVAMSGHIGELFQYVIHTPVTIARQRSAMLPIVNAEIKGEKVSIYNPSVYDKHPLNGLRLTNSTDLHLMQGPITVFDGGAYAGDAKIEDLPPGNDLLISYALDLDTEVDVTKYHPPEELVCVNISKGTLHAERKYERNLIYTIKNSSRKEKKLIIEVPVDDGWTLVEPKNPREKTRNLYRFYLDIRSGETVKFNVKQEQTDIQHIAITNINSGLISYYIKSRVVSDKVKSALRDIANRNHEIQLTSTQRQEALRQIQEIGKDQGRIRENMSRLPRDTDLYRRYLNKFSGQEDQVEDLQENVGKLTDKEYNLRQSLNEYLMMLIVS